MSKEDKLKNYVQNTYGELHAPEDLRRKVMNMDERNVKKKEMSVGRKLAMAAAIAAVLFAGSNGVAYAMTGSTWVETVVAKINLTGVWQEVEMEGVVLEDGTVQYSTTLNVQDEDSVEFVLISDATDADSLKIAGVGAESSFPEVYIVKDTSITVDNIGVAKEDDKVYARVSPMVVPCDSPLSSVDDVFNAILVRGNALGDAMFYGKGAGKLPTASAGVADIIDASQNDCRGIMWENVGDSFMETEDKAEYSWLVRADADKKAEAEKIFGNVEIVELNGEIGFVAKGFTPAQMAEKAAFADKYIRILK